ncbi:A/G-specific adenine glycosylase [Sphingobacterium bovistauri]|uniref:Adenine DNA glycosylase n=1 Tax=Sphingobacterium bovistauri TaxID=2781959 RepID=A0ABS7Z776_9SPHI|nr:A/G-specific adenine glycosylase [Sphingobacterium bovistauri]MCA5006005.1 A/G-specific adenine glycosylase [Sphingobacterium bovistauri]
MNVAKELITWYNENGRDLPWRQTNDPYIIWLSEIILQQTRVEQGLPYFYRFVEKYPDVKSFANADEDDLLLLWQGLGYYSRVRNMHKAAKMVIAKFDGNFPSKYDEVIQLTGVGEYTAAAISSFSINETRAVLDGNVFRVLARFFGVDIAINSTVGKKKFQQLANELICDSQSGIYNQAIMDFGATVCKPKAPKCEICVLNLECVALQEGLIDQLPVKNKSKPSRNRYFNYFIVERDEQILFSKRGDDDVWANMYEFPLIESDRELSMMELQNDPLYQSHFKGVEIAPCGETIKHILSHQNIYARFYKVVDKLNNIKKNPSWNYYNSDNLDKLAKHKLIFSFINKYFMN